MNLRQYLRRTALTVGGALGLLLVASALIIAFGITISLDPWRGAHRIGRHRGAWPAGQYHGPYDALTRTLANPGGPGASDRKPPQDWGGGDLLQVGLARGQLGVMALLGNRLRIKQITARDVALLLEIRPDGRENWRFDLPQTTPEGVTEAADQDGENAMELVAFDEPALRGVTLTHRDGASGQTRELRLDTVAGTAAADEDVELSIKGAYQQVPRLDPGSGGGRRGHRIGSGPGSSRGVLRARGGHRPALATARFLCERSSGPR